MPLPNIHLILVTAFISFFANWQFAYQITYINPSYDIIKEEAGYKMKNTLEINYELNKEWSGWWGLIVSSFYLGSIVGFMLVPYLISNYGTRLSFLYSTIPAIIGCLIQILPKVFSSYQCMKIW
uniref:MFS domain-containing protein n=1 Tax=Strongyloides venezuelensis TaxID=75913 RepID=A0A0K0FU58_STRVS